MSVKYVDRLFGVKKQKKQQKPTINSFSYTYLLLMLIYSQLLNLLSVLKHQLNIP